MSVPFVIRDLNGREFRTIRTAMSDASELMESGLPKDALAALKKARVLLESKIAPVRMLALVYIQEAQILLELGHFQKARKDLERAGRVLDAIDDQDETLRLQIVQLKEKTGSF